jgi:hypothetical protein
MKMNHFFLIPFLTITLFTIGNKVFGQNFNYHKEFKDILKKSMDKSNSYHFSKLLERFNKNDPSLSNKEIIALQIGFTADKNYKPYKTIDKERAIQKLISSKEYTKAIEQCDELLKTNPINFTALMEKGYAFMKLNREDKSYSKEKSLKIIQSIIWSGDGSSMNPYFVLGPRDGQILIKYVWGNSIGMMGSGEDVNGYFCDILSMNLKDGEKQLYFNIDHATKKMFSE